MVCETCLEGALEYVHKKAYSQLRGNFYHVILLKQNFAGFLSNAFASKWCR